MTHDRPVLYHYTDGRGLKGIMESQTIWFTDYRHLNDPSELVHGLEVAHDVIRLLETGADKRVRYFLDYLRRIFIEENFSEMLQFFIASFSDDRDDLGQWRAYADNGRGYAIGFAPRQFQETDKFDRTADENVFVGRVIYDMRTFTERHHIAIDEAIRIFLETINANAKLIEDHSVGIPFMQKFATEIIASPLIWNCLTSKHPAYKNEREVRLIITGLQNQLMQYVETRTRNSEIIPYIAHKIPVRDPHNIVEIVVGPASPPGSESSIRAMLASLGIEANIEITRSNIPYRTI